MALIDGIAAMEEMAAAEEAVGPPCLSPALGSSAASLRAPIAALLAGAALSACGGGGSSPGSVPAPSPTPTPAPTPAPPLSPTTAADAGRLLTQATFGANDATLQSVQSTGAAVWIDDQFTQPQTLHRTYLEAVIAAGPAGTPERIYRDYVMDTFWKQAITGTDQLRQRIVFALTELFVVSQANADVNARPRGLASYLDMLGANCFGNFRQLLEAVSLHPIMGLYLSSLRNQKEDPATGRVPDENYAREVMQLFTIGLYRLNVDGSLALDGSGKPVPTYGNTDVQGLARVFTGWSWAGPDTTSARFFGVAVADPDRDIRPMQFYPQYHSTSSKSFLGVTIPAGTDAPTSLRIALDTLFNHANVGPFVGRQLIERLVTSNPSSAYVARVASAFANNGAGVRGDMRAVLRAVLLDDEARSASAASQPGWGKLREPVLRLSAWARAFGATSASGNYTIRNVADPSTALAQNPLRSGSVFNFFRPGYVPPSTAISAANLVAPEFQITGESSVAGYLNFMRLAVDTGTGAAQDVRSNYATEVTLAGNPAALVDRVKLLLTANQMTDATRTTIVNAVSSISATATNAMLNRVKLAVFLTLASPEFIVQK
ncbi:MAG TPA: DUF1800 domain-containing protein [Burkholderiaceae bacterium]|nr:DUF1800 domain-containing protein [Burkholderiaceae bacterium]